MTPIGCGPAGPHTRPAEMDKATHLAAPAGPVDEAEFIVVFLVFIGIVSLSGLFLAWRYRRMERQQGQGSSEERKAQRATGPVMLPEIERLDDVDEQATAIQINLKDESPPPAADTGLVTTPVPPTDNAQDENPQRGP